MKILQFKQIKLEIDINDLTVRIHDHYINETMEEYISSKCWDVTRNQQKYRFEKEIITKSVEM